MYKVSCVLQVSGKEELDVNPSPTPLVPQPPRPPPSPLLPSSSPTTYLDELQTPPPPSSKPQAVAPQST